MVFLGESGLAMEPDSWERVFARASRRCLTLGKPVTCHPHMLRHSFALRMLLTLTHAFDRRMGLTPEERREYRPEFMKRLDEILLFNRLSRAHMTDNVEVQMQKLLKLLADRKIELKLDGKALQWLANRGYDPVYGARPLKRVIQRQLQDPLAMRILEGRLGEGEVARVDSADGRLTIAGEPVPLAA